MSYKIISYMQFKPTLDNLTDLCLFTRSPLKLSKTNDNYSIFILNKEDNLYIEENDYIAVIEEYKQRKLVVISKEEFGKIKIGVRE